MDRALLSASALLLNAVFGGPRSWYTALGADRIAAYPVRVLRELERKLNREQRSPEDRETRGQLLVAVVLAAGIIGGLILGALLTQNLRFIELLILASMLPVRPNWDRMSRLREYLQAGDLAAARSLFDGTVWRHHAMMDEHSLARAGIEMLAVHFSEKILSPIFWYVLLGLPGFFAAKLITLLQETMPKPSVDKGFGLATQQAHYLLHYLPSRLAALLWVAAGLFLPDSKPRAAARRIIDDLTRASPQRLALVSASATLQLSLGGPSSVYADEAWVENGTPKPSPNDVRRALFSFALLNILLFVLSGFLL